MKNIAEQSLFMNDNSNSDNKEVVIDFFLSWTLRCASLKNKDKYTPLVYEYSRTILSALLGVSLEELGEVSDVRTWKQSNRIDLWVEIDTEKKNYAMLIETKAYSKLHDDQLSRYKAIFGDYYAKEGRSVEQRFVVVVLDDSVPEDTRKESEKNGYASFSLEDIWDELCERINYDFKLTGSDLFDEFWLGIWH